MWPGPFCLPGLSSNAEGSKGENISVFHCNVCRFVQPAEVRSLAGLTGLNSSSEVWILTPSTLVAKNKSMILEINIFMKYLE